MKFKISEDDQPVRDHEADAAWRDAWVRCDDRLKRIKRNLDARTLYTGTLRRLMKVLAEAEALVEHDDPESEE